MKYYIQIVFAVVVLFSFVSCEKAEDVNSPESNPSNILNIETISAKWVINSDSEYNSFEFNESGHCIILKNNTDKSVNSQSVLFGSYSIVDTETIVLNNYGTIKVSAINENEINLSLMLDNDPGYEIILSGTKQNEISNSEATKLLCRTWQVVSIDGEPTDVFVVLFSDAGTYFITTPESSSLGYWQWCDAEQTKLAFTLSNNLDCGGIEVLTNIILTTYSLTATDYESGSPQEIIMEPI